MRPIGLLPGAVAGLLVVLTYLMAQGAAPDAAVHERTLDALRSIHLNHAALDRDVLRGRAGLLRNYDPLVAHIDNVQAALTTLRESSHAIGGPAGAQIQHEITLLAATIAEEEDALEAFKSSNALLQNSLSYFSHMTEEFTHLAADKPDPLAEIGALGNAMLRFLNAPQGESAAEVSYSLDRLQQLPLGADLREKAEALSAHGGIILAELHTVDKNVQQLLAPTLVDRARGVQDAYLDWHASAAQRAAVFRALLYGLSVLLALYLGYLFFQLRQNARALGARLGFERLIAAISTQFISLPREHLGDGITDALARLAEQVEFDRAFVAVQDADGKLERSYAWHRRDVALSSLSAEKLLDRVSCWAIPGNQQDGSIHLPRVSMLPASPEKSFLDAYGVKSWLCVPLGPANRRLGVLAFEAVHRETRWLEPDIALLRTAGEIFANAITRDRGNAERERLEAQLHQAQRLEAIGTLAGGIAHEFNNILGGILGYAEMLLNALPRLGRPRHHVEQVMAAAQRAKGIVDQILDFSRRSDRRHRPVAVQSAVEDALRFLRASLPATIALVSRLDAGAAAIVGDPGQLQQIVINLCTNAAHASQGRGTINIALDTLSVAEERALSHGRLTPGSYVRLSVQDQGHGIDSTTMERMFEPFFTTKAAGMGTGLGLSMVHGIVAQHGGALHVSSRVGGGSTFEVYLPQAASPAISVEQSPARLVLGQGETVLLVDDEKPLMLLGEEVLAALGYEPVGFDSSAAALAAFRADPQRFDLALTDEVMPFMTGTELAGALHEIRPELPVVIMTGYGGPLSLQELSAKGIQEVLKKPLLSADIAACLARILADHRQHVGTVGEFQADG